MPEDPYYSLPQCSNSDLSSLNKLMNPGFDYDFSDALRFGTLVDAMITEIEKVDVYKNTVEEYTYKPEEMELARAMKRAYFKDPTCAAFHKLASCQHVSIGKVKYEWCGFEFEIDARAKWDGFMPRMRMGYDIKTTTATTQRGFEDACEHFSYYRSRAFYMNLENTNKDMLIGISKVNLKVFKIPITRGDKNFEKGLAQASSLAFNYWQLFSGFNPNPITIL